MALGPPGSRNGDVMQRTFTHLTIGFMMCLTACGGRSASSEGAATPPPPPEPPPEHVPPPVEPDPVAKPEDVGVVILAKVGFQTPESVVHDPTQDVYFVSNINGSPTDKDDNGFISKITPSGEITLKFIDGADAAVQLNAPKGLAVAGGVLYVTDIDRVRMFDAKTGTPRGDIVIPGATFVNDIAAGPDGSLYVTDSGFKPDFSASGTDAVFKITSGALRKLTTEKDLGHPNGVLPDAGGTWIVTFGSGELYWVSDKGKRESAQKVGGQNDGVVRLKDGRVCVSSWETSSVHCGSPGGSFIEVVTGVASPADIGYDEGRNRLLIPLFSKDEVILHDLPAQGEAGEADSGT